MAKLVIRLSEFISCRLKNGLTISTNAESNQESNADSIARIGIRILSKMIEKMGGLK